MSSGNLITRTLAQSPLVAATLYVAVVGSLGYLCYLMLPACGPVYYLFGTAGRFRNAMP